MTSASLGGVTPRVLLTGLGAVATVGAIIIALFSAGCAGPRSDLPVLDASLPLRLSDLESRTHDIDAALARGETVALVFWQPACRSCAREAPELNRAVAEHGGTIRFLGVVPGAGSLSDEELRAAASKFGYRFPQARDDAETLCRDLEVVATPTLIVLGEGREVRYRSHHLPGDWTVLTAAQPN